MRHATTKVADGFRPREVGRCAGALKSIMGLGSSVAVSKPARGLLLALALLCCSPAWAGVNLTNDGYMEAQNQTPGAYPMTVTAWVNVTSVAAINYIWFQAYGGANADWIGIGGTTFTSTVIMRKE